MFHTEQYDMDGIRKTQSATNCACVGRLSVGMWVCACVCVNKTEKRKLILKIVFLSDLLWLSLAKNNLAKLLVNLMQRQLMGQWASDGWGLTLDELFPKWSWQFVLYCSGPVWCKELGWAHRSLSWNLPFCSVLQVVSLAFWHLSRVFLRNQM